MKKYIYRTRDEQGRAIDDSVFAESEDEAIALVRAKGYKPEYIALSASVVTTSGAGGRDLVLERILSEFLNDVKACLKGVPTESIAFFFRQLAILHKAGFNLKKSIEVLRRETWPKPLEIAIDVVDKGLNAGKPFAFLLEQSPRVFSPVFTGIIKIGENSGSLQSALEKAAQLSEEETKVRKRISTALVYPGFLLTTFLIILAGLIFYLLPMMEGVFMSTGLKPPWLIQCIFYLIKLVKNPIVIAVIIEILIVLLFIYYSWIKQFNGRALLDGALLSVPVLGPFLLNTSLARCAYNLNLMLDSGIPLTRALEILPKAIGNESLGRTIIYARKDIMNGSTLSESLEHDGRFPRVFIQMLKVGEESGELPSCVHSLCRFYDQEVEVALASFLNIFEPLIIIFMGLLVGSVFLTFLPMINQLYKGLS